MLYKQIETADSSLLGIWKIEETKEVFLEMLDRTTDIEDILKLRSSSRILEKLAVLALLKQLTGEQKTISYLLSGRPYLADKSYNISISHTKGYAAVILNKERKVGIDIEEISEKIKRVRSRIISEDEFIEPKHELIHLLLHWSAKEAMCKLLDKKDINFLEELHVSPFIPQNEGVLVITERCSVNNSKFNAYFKVYDKFVMVITSV